MRRMGARIAAALALALMASPALAAVLPLDGAYGNESGCAFFATGRPADGMVLITPDTALINRTGCDFDSATSEADLYSVTGVCGTPGRESKTGEILKLRWADGRVTVIDGLEAVGPLLPCTIVIERGANA
jgi:hypothetical protein